MRTKITEKQTERRRLEYAFADFSIPSTKVAPSIHPLVHSITVHHPSDVIIHEPIHKNAEPLSRPKISLKPPAADWNFTLKSDIS